MRVLLIDFYDSFTYNLAHYLESMGLELTVCRYDKLSAQLVHASDAFILSPGPGLPHEKKGLQELLTEFIGKKPILGVCLGMQALVEHMGGALENQCEVKHGVSEKINIHHHEGLFKHLPTEIEVGLYHSWKVACPPDWISATSQKGVVMAIERPKLQVYGVQFHPESVMTPMGKEILHNFIQIVRHA